MIETILNILEKHDVGSHALMELMEVIPSLDYDYNVGDNYVTLYLGDEYLGELYNDCSFIR